MVPAEPSAEAGPKRDNPEWRCHPGLWAMEEADGKDCTKVTRLHESEKLSDPHQNGQPSHDGKDPLGIGSWRKGQLP
jgi:hypothetical protein